MRYSCLLLATVLSGCSTLSHMFDGNRATLESAQRVENPRVAGAANPNVLGHDGELSEVKMKSYNAKSGEICFSVRTPNPEALDDVQLVTFRSIEEYDGKKPTKEKPAGVHVVGTGKALRSYEATETVTHKDSSGRVYATSEAPVTKSESVRYSDVEACFPGKVLTDEARYMALQTKTLSLMGSSDVFIAAWRF